MAVLPVITDKSHQTGRETKKIAKPIDLQEYPLFESKKTLGHGEKNAFFPNKQY